MANLRDRKSENCLNPWFKYLTILCIVVVTLLAILGFKDKSDEAINELKSHILGDDQVSHVLISSSGVNLRDNVAVQFETCRTFIIVNPATERCVSISNDPNTFDVNAIRKIARTLNVKAVITGTVSMETHKVLYSSDIDIYTGVSGRAKDALRLYERHELTRSENLEHKGSKSYYMNRTQRIKRKIL